MPIRFLQLHWLASFPGTLLNRDDAGLGKRLPFGGVTRGRVSSQSLKRHWRLAGSERLDRAGANPWALQNLEVPMGVRTKLAVEEKIIPRAVERQPAAEPIREAVESTLLRALHGKDATDPKKRQALYFGEPEIEFLADLAAGAMVEDAAEDAATLLEDRLKAERTNLRALKHGAGLGAALFGRMVTSDRAANTDAAIHVAHAITVHAMERELDYMTVVDDLIRPEDEEHAGAAGVFDMELTSGLYYGYVVVDIDLLVSNLTGDFEIAAKVIEHLIHLVAQVSPGAKKGSTAPYAWAELMLLETGSLQPRTLANAFRNPIRLPDRELLKTAVERMGTHLGHLDEAYGTDATRRQLAVHESAALPGIERMNLSALGGWAADAIRERKGSSG